MSIVLWGFGSFLFFLCTTKEGKRNSYCHEHVQYILSCNNKLPHHDRERTTLVIWLSNEMRLCIISYHITHEHTHTQMYMYRHNRNNIMPQSCTSMMHNSQIVITAQSKAASLKNWALLHLLLLLSFSNKYWYYMHTRKCTNISNDKRERERVLLWPILTIKQEMHQIDTGPRMHRWTAAA